MTPPSTQPETVLDRASETAPGLEPVVACEDVRFSWDPRPARRLFGGARARGSVFSLDRFRLEAGERLAVTGPSGGGKSTLLAILAGVARAQRGRVVLCGRDLTALSGAERDRWRADMVGVMFQEPALPPFARALDAALLGLSFSRMRRAQAAARGGGEAEALRLFAALGLDAAAAHAPVRRLSVGQRQRVAATRALIGGPAVILADEPTSALDPTARDAFLALLLAEADRAGAAVLMATHDAEAARRLGAVRPLSSFLRGESGL